jgi:hypothetical protein
VVHGRFWLVNVICLLNCDNERDLCQLLDAAFAVGWWSKLGFGLTFFTSEKAELLLIGIMRLLNALKREPKAGL